MRLWKGTSTCFPFFFLLSFFFFSHPESCHKILIFVEKSYVLGRGGPGCGGGPGRATGRARGRDIKNEKKKKRKHEKNDFFDVQKRARNEHLQRVAQIEESLKILMKEARTRQEEVRTKGAVEQDVMMRVEEEVGEMATADVRV